MIDITNQAEIRKLTLTDLINDAVERKDTEALRWLKEESGKTVTTISKTGKTVESQQRIITIRSLYLKMFLGYKPKGGNMKSKEQRDMERETLFADAFAKLGIK